MNTVSIDSDPLPPYYMSNGDVLKRIDPQREKGVDDLKGGELALPNGEYAISPRVVDLKIASEE